MRKQLIYHIAVILWAAWRRRYLIAVPILVMPFLGLAAGFFSPKKYETYTTILIQEAAKQNPFLEDLAIATNLKSRMEALNALLHSRHILTEVALKLGLINQEMDETTRRREIAKLSKALKSKLVGEDLIKITYTANNPDNMAETLKLVSLRFVERVIAPQRSSIAQSETFLKTELDTRRTDLFEAEAELAEYKSLYASELPELHAANVTRLSHIRALLADRKIALEGAKGEEAKIRERLSLTNPVVGKIEETIVETMAELTALRASYTDRHTKIQAALRRLEALENERNKVLQQFPKLEGQNLDRLWNMATSNGFQNQNGVQPLLVSQLERLQDAQSQCERLEEEISGLETELKLLSDKVNGFGEHERRLNELQREIEVRRKIYSDLAERHQLARVTGALGKSEESERIKLIDPPFTPLAPSNLPLIFFVIAGLVGGICFGCGIAFVIEMLDTTIRRKEALAQMINAPVFIRIPPKEE
ncbi:GumC family protein [Curvivirga sp.]|uniref:GumC family protein n=1 Tax=Curvivirga sp. TaxID=2856848 RepID=UPI003B5CBC37